MKGLEPACKAAINTAECGRSPDTPELRLWLSFSGKIGAVEKTRTSTGVTPQRPQRCASTNSATTALDWWSVFSPSTKCCQEERRPFFTIFFRASGAAVTAPSLAGISVARISANAGKIAEAPCRKNAHLMRNSAACMQTDTGSNSAELRKLSRAEDT